MRILGHSSPWYCKLIAISLALVIYFNLVGLSAATDGAGSRARDLDEDIRYFEDEEHARTHILSRKRRYLTFPSGSSFQLVYDLIIGMVDYTNYLIFGVTSALAWQLPSEPPSEIVENLRTRLEEGSLGTTSRNDTIENIQYVDTKPKQRKPSYIPSYSQSSYSSSYTGNVIHPPMHTKYYESNPVYYTNPAQSASNKVDSGYYTVRQNPLTDWKQGSIRAFPSSLKSSSPPSTLSSLMSKWSQWWKSGRSNSGQSPSPPRHRIYPVFAKRSAHNRQKRHGIIGTTLTETDKMHLRYHRSTRQDLYLKIEKYLEYHKRNGHQCVLKALCETGRKGSDAEPGTFVGEIMRAVFTMPESEDPVHNHLHKRYDEAHAGDEDCIEKYPLCPDSLWKADFIL